MAEQRTPGSGGTSPAQERGSQGRDTTQEVSAQITETARHVGETASQYYAQGRQQLEGMGAVAGGEYSGQAAAIRLAGHGDWSAPGTPLEEIAGAGAAPREGETSTTNVYTSIVISAMASPASRHPERASRRQEGGC